LRLSFILRATQTCQQRTALDERDTRPRETDPEAIEERETAAGECGTVEDRIEAGGFAIARTAVAGRVEKRQPRADPIAVVRNFQRSAAGSDPDTVSVLETRIRTGDRIQI